MAVILIVEDDAMIRENAVMLVEDWGYETLSASDVDEALTLLRSSQPIDVLFTDICLKDEAQGGCTLAKQAIKLRPQLRVLYTTGNSMTQQLKALFVAGANCFRKPYSGSQLREHVGGLLA